MPRYRRARTQGGTYFFTIVTYRRRKIFTNDAVINALRQAIKEVKQTHPFTIEAWVLLPDHMHCVWNLPDGDDDYSKRVGMIKAGFTSRVKTQLQKPEWITDSRARHGEGMIWQRRFWEHEIKDEHDFERHVDYVHYNPVKHGLVKRVCDWPYSTFHRYVEKGVYSKAWGGGAMKDVSGAFGE